VYSPSIVGRRLYAAKKRGMKYQRLPRDKSIEIAAKLERLQYKDNKRLPEGQLIRPLDDREVSFIQSERLLCQCDFVYYFERYHKLQLDPGVVELIDTAGTVESVIDGSLQKIGPPRMLESQCRYIELIGRREAECMAEWNKYHFCTGILAVFHKCRQVAATATARGLTMHRMIFWPGTRAFAASVDAPRITELFARDHLAADNLPFWLKPSQFLPDVKDTELGFPAPLSSRCGYQAENQQAGGIGVGTQQDVSHLTEVALWQYPGRIKFSFLPALPKAITTLHIEESTSDGKGNYWHELSEAVRHKKEGYESWIYAFIPWWYNRLKYRDIPPLDWAPAAHTLRHAELIERSSPEFYDGNTYHPTIEQLFWWQTERARHVQQGELATFLTNYPATPEQSFQSPNQGALPVELIEEMETEILPPEVSFELEPVAQAG